MKVTLGILEAVAYDAWSVFLSSSIVALGVRPSAVTTWSAIYPAAMNTAPMVVNSIAKSGIARLVVGTLGVSQYQSEAKSPTSRMTSPSSKKIPGFKSLDPLFVHEVLRRLLPVRPKTKDWLRTILIRTPLPTRLLLAGRVGP